MSDSIDTTTTEEPVEVGSPDVAATIPVNGTNALACRAER
jgi:hypothetical protein